jgi:hypothetical protein
MLPSMNFLEPIQRDEADSCNMRWRILGPLPLGIHNGRNQEKHLKESVQ